MQQRDAEHLIYNTSKAGPGGSRAQILTPLQLLDRLAVLVPPPRVHRHRYYSVLAPNSPLRPAVTALAVPEATHTPAAPPTDPAPPSAELAAARRAARYAWALLLARIYAVLPLRCPRCGGEMRIIAFITATAVVRDILIHLGEPIAPPVIAPARGPPLWAAQDDAASDALPADTRASRCQPPDVCSPAPHCLRQRPGNLPRRRVDSGSSALDPRLTGITNPEILGFVCLNFLSLTGSLGRLLCRSPCLGEPPKAAPRFAHSAQPAAFANVIC